MTVRRRQLRHRRSQSGDLRKVADDSLLRPGAGDRSAGLAVAGTLGVRRSPVAVERLDATPEMDAVLDGLPSSIRWHLLFPLLGFIGCTLLALRSVYSEMVTPTYGGPNWLVIFVGLTMVFGALAIATGSWMFRAVANAKRNTRPERRRYLFVRGTVRLHERKEGRFWRHWLVTARGEDIVIGQDVLD